LSPYIFFSRPRVSGSTLFPYTTLFRSVWSAGYGPSSEMLARIAPGRGFNFSDGKQPLAMARKSLTEMADLLNLQSAAETHLAQRSEEHTSELQSRFDLVCRLLLEKKKL